MSILLKQGCLQCKCLAEGRTHTSVCFLHVLPVLKQARALLPLLAAQPHPNTHPLYGGLFCALSY